MLDQPYPTLPSAWYFDPAHHRRELAAIWWRGWICLGRAGEWEETGSFRRFDLGGQQIFVTRGGDGGLNGFHNTCRHRGSILCSADSGRFRGQRIVCPYHSWSYGLDGRLVATPFDFTAGSPARDVSARDDRNLYRVAIDTWAGFVFAWLDGEPDCALHDWIGADAAALTAWPLTELVFAHREHHELACNWKVFWENFSECYHCPGLHPDLCRLVPVYQTSLSSAADLPTGHPFHRESHGALAPGAVTWSDDGQTPLPWFPGLGPAERDAGMTFCTSWPSLFIIAHVDYVRTVRVWPLDAERCRLTIDWLLLPATLQQTVDIERLVRFGRQVVLEDARACELNQLGLHSIRHHHGQLMPQEHDVLAFDNWVRTRLGEAPLT